MYMSAMVHGGGQLPEASIYCAAKYYVITTLNSLKIPVA